MRQLRPLSLDQLHDEHGWDAPGNPTVGDTTDTPTLAAIASRLTPAQLAAWECVAFTTAQKTAAELLGKQPENVRQLMAQVRRRASGIHVPGRSAGISRSTSREET